MIMARMAIAAKEGGAVGIRANSVEDIKAIKQAVNLPIIGLIKADYDDSDIFITPTKKEVMALINSGCEMIALDATNRKRPNDERLEDLLQLIHDANVLAMADISTKEEAIHAQQLGFDCVSTTLSGYTPYSTQSNDPDFELVKCLVNTLSIPVIAEGRIHRLTDAVKIQQAKPHSIVIGSAITRPQIITKRFIDALNGAV